MSCRVCCHGEDLHKKYGHVGVLARVVVQGTESVLLVEDYGDDDDKSTSPKVEAFPIKFCIECGRNLQRDVT